MQLVKIARRGTHRFHGTAQEKRPNINKLTPLAGGKTVPYMQTAQAPWGCANNRSGPLGGPSAFRSTTRLCHANFRSCPPLSFDRRFRPALLHARRLRGRTGLSALQYRAHRRERLSHLGGGGRLRRERAFDRSEGKHADDQRRETDEGREEQRRGAL